jgi:bifunctional non-homologous end joining protein LigD
MQLIEFVMTAPKLLDRAKHARRIGRLVLPGFRPPQIATLQRDVPDDDNWLFELIYGGYRCQIAIAGGEVRIYNRHGRDCTDKFPQLIPALSDLTTGTLLLDGEICALDDDGRTDRNLLKARISGKGPLVFFGFDLLEQEGEDVGLLPQLERKRQLAALLAEQPVDSPLLYSQHVVGNGKKVFDAIRAGGYEGIVGKWPNSRYYSGGRSTAWIEIKALRQQDFVVLGWLPSPDDDAIAGLVVGTYEGGRLVYRGTVETGFTRQGQRNLARLLADAPARRQPRIYGMSRSEARGVYWAQLRYVAQIDFSDVTAEGRLVRATYRSIREDEDARGIHLELS